MAWLATRARGWLSLQSGGGGAGSAPVDPGDALLLTEGGDAILLTEGGDPLLLSEAA